jgi:NAD(P)-dependent dehydrogenase (short-subunit alcohol dehydrogenase family)
LSRYGALHVACNNAGISGAEAPTSDYPPQEWDKVIAVNLSGVFYGMRYQIPAMLASEGGSIINVSSILGITGFRNSPAYVAAKHGVIGLTKTAALEYARHNIRINAVCPGFINTPLLNTLSIDEKERIIRMHPMDRLGEAYEVAELVLWLSCEKASFVTGAHYVIDGGYLAQ